MNGLETLILTEMQRSVIQRAQRPAAVRRWLSTSRAASLQASTEASTVQPAADQRDSTSEKNAVRTMDRLASALRAKQDAGGAIKLSRLRGGGIGISMLQGCVRLRMRAEIRFCRLLGRQTSSS